MKGLSYIGKIDATGRLTGPAADKIREELKAAFAGQFVKVEISGWATPVSSGKRGYYFGVLIPAVLRGLRDLGNRVDPTRKDHQKQCHEMLKSMFLEGVQVKDAAGNLTILPPSMENMSDDDWSRYLDEIDQWAQEYLGISISKEKAAR